MVSTSASPSGPVTPSEGAGPFLAPALHFAADLAILAPEKQQRLALAQHYILRFSNKNSVIARLLGRLQPAFHVRQRPVQNRSSVHRAVKPGPSFHLRVRVAVHRSRIIF